MKVALCQFHAEKDIDSNLDRVMEVLRSRSSDLAVFPELFLSSYGGRMDPEQCIQYVALMKLASEEAGTDLCIGLPKTVGDRTYDQLVYLSSADPDGIFAYEKMHIAGFEPYCETFERGKRPMVVDKGDIRIGLSICYDVMFPELYRTYALGFGADMFIVASASKESSRRYMDAVLPARQLENTAYLLFVNNVGDGFFGGSRAYSPLGEEIASLDGDEGILHVDVNTWDIGHARRIRPHLSDSTLGGMVRSLG